MLTFGVGNVFITPAGANPTPIQIGILQDISLDATFTQKELHGQNQYAVAVARAQAKISGKAKAAQFNGSLLLGFFTGSTQAAGQTEAAQETDTIPGTPYQVTVTNSATFVADGGVRDLTAGKYLTEVASAPATGQYSYAAGVYTFAAADTTHSVQILYSYTVAASGLTTSVTNQLMGAQTTYTLNLFNTYNNVAFGYKLWAVVFPKLSFPMKNEDFTVPELDFEAYADSSNRVATFYTGD